MGTTIMGIEVKTFVKKRRRLGRSFPTGTIFFTGKQGAGKSLSATHYLSKIKEKYPDLYIYSNIKLKIADKIIKSEEVADYILDRKIEGDACGECGKCLTGEICKDQKEIPIAFFLDEIQTVLFSGNKSVSFETFKAICQQRKALKTIIGTMQEFLDLDIKYRRQLQAQVECLHIGAVQLELWKDPETLHFDEKKNDYVGRTFRVNIWKRHNEAYDIYDTFEIVDATMKMDTAKKQAHLKNTTNFVGTAPT